MDSPQFAGRTRSGSANRSSSLLIVPLLSRSAAATSALGAVWVPWYDVPSCSCSCVATYSYTRSASVLLRACRPSSPRARNASPSPPHPWSSVRIRAPRFRRHETNLLEEIAGMQSFWGCGLRAATRRRPTVAALSVRAAFRERKGLYQRGRKRHSTAHQVGNDDERILSGLSGIRATEPENLERHGSPT